MAVYGIWSRGHKQWLNCGFTLCDGRFTQHRGVAVVLLGDLKASLHVMLSDGTKTHIWEKGDISVRALGEDGLPVAGCEEEGDDILIDEALPRLPLTRQPIKLSLTLGRGGNPNGEGN